MLGTTTRRLELRYQDDKAFEKDEIACENEQLDERIDYHGWMKKLAIHVPEYFGPRATPWKLCVICMI